MRRIIGQCRWHVEQRNTRYLRLDMPTQVIPKYHARTIGDLPDEYLSDIGPLLKKIAIATGAEQYNILQNNGKLAFQHVDHVHFHVIPKTTEEDGLVLKIAENWPTMKVDKEELNKTVEIMKGRL
ncbi:HIT-like domain-containing protein [Gautieria morchelliformis]|nr:HIT-like domain-containing protein [Gautieria morchelliformis]